MKNKIVCNIPHANTMIPDWAIKDMLVSRQALADLVDFMVDKEVDKLWGFVPTEYKQTASMSRLVLDVERFRKDEDEPMSAKGMGLYYTHTPEGKPFRLKSADTYRRVLFVYEQYHKALEEKVARCLRENGQCILLDCHSFHDGMAYTDYRVESFPDVCIGVNGSVSPTAQRVVEIFKEHGYTVKINEPFSGTLIPLKYLHDERVEGVMIELNRRIYEGASFEKVRAICKEIFEKLNG